MKVVIDIPEEHLKTLRQLSGLGYYHEVIAKGQPLSDIIDKVEAEWKNKGEFEIHNEYDMGVDYGYQMGFYEALSMINNFDGDKYDISK